jgi:DNA-binding NtrC family response regulator
MLLANSPPGHDKGHKSMPKLLVIDDEDSVLYSFKRVFESEKMTVLTARSGAEGLAMVRAHDPEVVVIDLQLPDDSGLKVFQHIHADDHKRPVIFITAHGTTQSAIEAMKHGAFDYLIKPVNLDHLSQIIDRAFEAARLMHVPAMLSTEDRGDRIVGHSKVIQEMCKMIGRFANQDVNVLILGESGTGKELVARAVYHHSRRADKPFLAINCAAIPETLLESELFGHEEGAFTGATRRRIGKFEQCHGGTLFLDEIGDMSAAVQAKMLRVLQGQQFERLGSNETLQTDVRILAATNQHLDKLVAEGRFRKDLYYRLKGVTIQVPPLAARLEDVSELAHYFLFRFNHELGLDLHAFAPETLDILERYTWPGNVRELQSVIKQAMVNASGYLLLPEFLPSYLLAETHKIRPAFTDAAGLDLLQSIDSMLQRHEKNIHASVVKAVERILIARVLRHTRGHQARASEILGLSRATLRFKLRTLGLSLNKVAVNDTQPEPRD